MTKENARQASIIVMGFIEIIAIFHGSMAIMGGLFAVIYGIGLTIISIANLQIPLAPLGISIAGVLGVASGIAIVNWGQKTRRPFAEH